MKTGEFEGKSVVVTGGAGAIGTAIARAFLEQGAHVHLFDRNEAQLSARVDELGDRASAQLCDVTDEASFSSCIDAVAGAGRIDVLVNNAGIAIRKDAVNLELADWDKVIGVNLTGVFLGARLAARHMIATGGGAIVNIASIMGLSGGGIYPNISYQASKGGVVNLTRALAVEWAPKGIRVNAVAPTWVRSELTTGLFADPAILSRIHDMTPLRSTAEPEDVAHAVRFLASIEARMITGHTLPVDGGYLAQ